MKRILRTWGGRNLTLPIAMAFTGAVWGYTNREAEIGPGFYQMLEYNISKQGHEKLRGVLVPMMKDGYISKREARNLVGQVAVVWPGDAIPNVSIDSARNSFTKVLNASGDAEPGDSDEPR